MSGKYEGGAPQQKRSRTATVSYPYHPLDLCIKFAEGVKQIGNGRQDVDKSVLAAHLNVDEKSGDFAQKIASCKTYGLLEGKAALQLTESARNYFFPTENPEKVKAAALLKFFSSPGAYIILIEAHDGSKPPSNEIMGNVLGQKYGIPESWKSRVATFFLRSGVTAGAIESDGFLRYRAKVQSLESVGPAQANRPTNGATVGTGTAHQASAQQESFSQDNSPNNPQSDVVVWRHGKILRVETPENLASEVWEKLNRYIQAIKP